MDEDLMGLLLLGLPSRRRGNRGDHEEHRETGPQNAAPGPRDAVAALGRHGLVGGVAMHRRQTRPYQKWQVPMSRRGRSSARTRGDMAGCPLRWHDQSGAMARCGLKTYIEPSSMA
ncbi:MAG TPA: hypothetical protein VNM90_19605, partial [Haliangium sp.]|nr:hypothetical protein [Haliangium sp.]